MLGGGSLLTFDRNIYLVLQHYPPSMLSFTTILEVWREGARELSLGADWSLSLLCVCGGGLFIKVPCHLS